MRRQEQYLVAALNHLQAARREYSKLTSISPDWTAVVMVDAAFDQLEDEMKTFAMHHYGIGVTNFIVDKEMDCRTSCRQQSPR